MPELPEVETVRQGLLPVMRGQVLAELLIARYDLRGAIPPDMAARLAGRRIVDIARRGKYMIMLMDGPDSVLWHLGMSGRVRIDQPGEAASLAEKHDHVVMVLSSGARVVFNDARRFGMFYLIDSQNWEAEAPFHAMGPEPLSNHFSGAVLFTALQKRTGPVKTALLDQRVVSGLGNIYVCEALFEAGIHPQRRGKDVSAAEADRLARHIVTVLQAAIRAGGSSLKDYRQADGQMGYFQHAFKVYGREGEACTKPNCSGMVERLVQSGRSTFYCEKCQL